MRDKKTINFSIRLFFPMNGGTDPSWFLVCLYFWGIKWLEQEVHRLILFNPCQRREYNFRPSPTVGKGKKK